MNTAKTYQLAKIYHRFLKPRGIPISELDVTVSRLYEAGFIDLFQDPENNSERYVELDKLTSREHRDELFKIINQPTKGGNQ